VRRGQPLRYWLNQLRNQSAPLAATFEETL
jgi:hypothetical protein